MAWHVEFRDDLDMALGSVSYYLPDLVLSVETRRCLGISVASGRPDSRKFGIFLDLDPPAGGVGKMPVELVEFVVGHQVQSLQYEFLAEEMPGLVKHVTSPFKAGRILDGTSKEHALVVPLLG